MRYQGLFLVGIILVLMNCTSALTKNELKNYVLDKDNGLVGEITKNGISVQVTFKPKDLVIAQEVGGNRERWVEVESALDSMDYFVLKISRQGQAVENQYAGDPKIFSNSVNYLAGGLAKDVSLEIGKERIEVEDMVYAQSFGVSEGSEMLIVFKSALMKRGNDFSFIFEDTMFGSGRCEFDFKIRDLESVPPLVH